MKLRLQSAIPLVFSLTFAILIARNALTRLATWEQPALTLGVAAVGFYLIWLIVEGRIAVTEIKRERTGLDIGTCEAYALGRAITTLAALSFPTAWHSNHTAMPAGFVIFIAGVALRLFAINTLGRFYSHRVRVADDHEVVDTGPYRWLRHPAYTGMLLAHFGFVTLFFNYWAIAAWGALLVSIVLRIHVEERALFKLPGYATFAAKRQRLVPGLW